MKFSGSFEHIFLNKYLTYSLIEILVNLEIKN